MKIIFDNHIEADVLFGLDTVQVVSCNKPGKELQIENEIELLASKSVVGNDEARKLIGLPKNIGSRNVPLMIRGILSSFNGRVYPLKTEVVCFALLDDRYATPILWKKR